MIKGWARLRGGSGWLTSLFHFRDEWFDLENLKEKENQRRNITIMFLFPPNTFKQNFVESLANQIFNS